MNTLEMLILQYSAEPPFKFPKIEKVCNLYLFFLKLAWKKHSGSESLAVPLCLCSLYNHIKEPTNNSSG